MLASCMVVTVIKMVISRADFAVTDRRNMASCIFWPNWYVVAYADIFLFTFERPVGVAVIDMNSEESSFGHDCG